MGEHLPCKQGVMSSNLTISTQVRNSYRKNRNRNKCLNIFLPNFIEVRNADARNRLLWYLENFISEKCNLLDYKTSRKKNRTESLR